MSDVNLTPRQEQFLSLVAEGKTRAQIADACDVSPWTVKSTLDEARQRLGARNLSQAVATLGRDATSGAQVVVMNDS